MPSTSTSIKIFCPLVLGDDGFLHRDTLLIFSTEGILESIDYDVHDADMLAHTQHYNGVLIPSMINTHNHLELSYFNGVIPEGIGLVSFIRHVIGHRHNTAISDRIRHLDIQDKIMWREGVGAVGDISNDHFSFEIKSRSPIYYHTFVEYFGLTPQEMAVNYFERSYKSLSIAEELNLTATTTPHSTYMVSDELFKRQVDSDRLSIHFMETSSELDLFNRDGDMYDFITSDGTELDFLHYGSHTQRLIDSLPSDKKLLLVHCTQMKRQDIEQIMGYFTDVTFVTCPRSNYYIERCFPPLDDFKSLGCRVAIGTDSLCSNTSYSLASEIEWILKHYNNIGLEDVLGWVTINGAKALGVEDKLGSFKVGTKCGAVLLEGLDLNSLRPIDGLSSRRLV